MEVNDDLPAAVSRDGENYILDLEHGVARTANTVLAGLLGLGAAAAFAWGHAVLAMLLVALMVGLGVDMLRPPLLKMDAAGLSYTTPWPFLSWSVRWEEVLAHEVGQTLSLTLSGGREQSALLFQDKRTKAWLQQMLEDRLGIDPLERVVTSSDLDGDRIELGGESPEGTAITIAIALFALGVAAAVFYSAEATYSAVGILLLGLAAAARTAMRPRLATPALRIGRGVITLMHGEQVQWRLRLADVEVSSSLLDSELIVDDGQERRRVLLRGRRQARQLVVRAVQRASEEAKRAEAGSEVPGAVQQLRDQAT